MRENTYRADFWKTLPDLLRDCAAKYPSLPAQYSKDENGEFQPRTFAQLFQDSLDFAGGLAKHGVKRGDRIGLISENRREWEQADMGLLILGAVDTPRGCDATEADLTYILSFSESMLVIAENNSQVKKILNNAESIPTLRKIICFEEVEDAQMEQAKKANIEMLDFNAVVEEGKAWRKENPNYVEAELDKGKWDDLASIIFTSGTTGTPKGVMLTHGNILAQIDEAPERVHLNPGERCLVILPVWHAFQRALEYVILAQGASLNYSKPIGSILLPDLKKVNPTMMPAVPRVYEALYDGIWKKMKKAGGATLALFKFFLGVAKAWKGLFRFMFNRNTNFLPYFIPGAFLLGIIPFILLSPLQALGNALILKKIRGMVGKNWRVGIAGGGAYPEYIDKFFWAVGINVAQGYGLTETAPVVSVNPWNHVRLGNVGTPLRHVYGRVVDDEGKVLKPGQKGILQIKGDTVMQGYYKREDLTSKVLSADGWLDTGDIVRMSRKGEIKIYGRQKDTIVLLGGENIEPLPIETKLKENSLFATVVVCGQDQRFLTALILPNKDEVEAFAAKNQIKYESYEELLKTEAVHDLYANLISENISGKNGFKAFEKINDFVFITKPFEIGVELSAKQEMKRYTVYEMYKKQIAEMYK